MSRALITEFTFISPIGSEKEDFRDRLFAGRSGIRNITGKFSADFPIHSAGIIAEQPGETNALAIGGNLLRSLLKQLPAPNSIDGMIFFIPPQEEPSMAENKSSEIDSQIKFLNQIIEEETGGALLPENMISINEACITGISSLNLAAQRIRAGTWKRAVVLGVDFRCTALDLLRFHSLGALSTREVSPELASCPFSLERDGFVKSEGAAAILLEEAGGSICSPWAEVIGFGQSADAWRLTEGRPDGKAAAQAIRQALDMARIDRKEINCFSAHATSTRAGDALETRLIKSIWGEAAETLPITALKSQIGHTGHVSGLLQVISSLFMLREQKISPTINLKARDPNCDLDYVPEQARPADLKTILCNAHGFGGQNACLILRSI